MSNIILNSELSYKDIVIYPNGIKLDEIKQFKFPENVKFYRIDVGLSYNSAHSVDWLLNTQDRGVIGIEPHPVNVDKLLSGKNEHTRHSFSLNSNYIGRNDVYSRKTIDGRYLLIKCALDDVKDLEFVKFYSAYPDHGNSGLIPFQTKNISGNIIEYAITVPSIPLSNIIDKIDAEFIEVIKIDAELKDLDIIKSCGELITKVVYLRVEAFKGFFPNTIDLVKSNLIDPETYSSTNEGYWDGSIGLNKYLTKMGFELIDEEAGDFKYLNKSLKHLIPKYNLTY